jgi:hypothetical protein
MTPTVYNLYQMKDERLPRGVREAWLHTYPRPEASDRLLDICRCRTAAESIHDS